MRRKTIGLARRVGWLMLFAFLFAFFAGPIAADDDHWQAKYWNNKKLEGDPVLERLEDEIDFNWGYGNPQGINEDEFSVRWKRNVFFEAGTYRFTAVMDDGMRAWIDGRLIIDSWVDGRDRPVSADTFVAQGAHDLKVEYYEDKGSAQARFEWQRIGLAPGTFIANWRGDYFSNIDLSGAPAVVRDDLNLDFSWDGAPAGGMPSDQFSVRWTRSLFFTPGRYRFTVTADDGVRLRVNNQLLIDQWHDQVVTSYIADIDLAGGAIPIEMTFYENKGEAVAKLTWGLLMPGVPPPAPIGQWQAQYFNNVDLTGAPVATRQEGAIHYIWGVGSPVPGFVDADKFSVRWAGSWQLTPGRYTFTAAVDDGVRLWVNGLQLLNVWTTQPLAAYTATVDLPGGPTAVVMEYFEATGLAEAHLSWSLVGAAGSTGETAVATVTGASYLNVRSGPGVAFEPFTVLSYGQVVTLLGRDEAGIWLKVQLANGQIGWVSGRYLSSTTPYSTLPIVG